MSRLRSLRNKLALLFFAVTGLAFAGIYFYVVPQLQSNLEEQKMRDLLRSARSSEAALERLIGNREVEEAGVNRVVRAVADNADARLTLLSVQRSADGSLQFYTLSDSREEEARPATEGLARAAVRAGRIRTGERRFRGEELGQVAQPISYRGEVAWVALYSRSLEDVADTVAVLRERILVASGLALVLALAGGYLVARRVGRRVGRIERRARELTAGRFSDPLPVDSADELGQLTRAFNEMQHQLRRVDVARKEFVATASHELRTPIFSLAGFVELLQDEELDDETRREFLDTMSEQVARLQKLSVDLLDLSRLDAGSLRLRSERLDLAELGRSVVGEFTPVVVRQGAVLDVRLRRRVNARADRERVAQIMRILLDNALRHTPEGTHVTVSADRDNGAAEFTVADAGPGLSGDARERVFERFWTGDAASGAGLGLAIAKELAERMDGDITVVSGRAGTRFTLALPSEAAGR